MLTKYGVGAGNRQLGARSALLPALKVGFGILLASGPTRLEAGPGEGRLDRLERSPMGVEQLAAAGSWVSAREGLPSVYASAYGASTYVAVGSSATILTSSTGISWTRRPVPLDSSTELAAVLFGKGQFVAFGRSYRQRATFVLTSPDGRSWTTRRFEGDHYVSDLAFGNDRFVAVGGGGWGFTSIDGVEWTQQPGGVYADRVAFGNGTFVAASRCSSEPCSVFTSPDGVTWTPQVTPAKGGVAFLAHAASVFVALDVDGQVLTSPDGISWAVEPARLARAYAMVAGAGVIAAVGSRSIATSHDGGRTWIDRTISGDRHAYYTVVHGRRGFTALGSSGSLATSPTGTTWTRRTAPASRALAGVAHDGDRRLCAVGEYAAASSADGARWTNRNGFPDLYATAIGWGLDRFVAVGSKGRVVSSPDCIRWSSVGTEKPDWWFSDVAFADGLFVAVGSESGEDSSDNLIVTSLDGVNWTRSRVESRPGRFSRAYAVGFGGGTWVALTSSGTLVSSNATEWFRNDGSGPQREGQGGVTYGDGIFVAAAGRGIWTSPDGIEWTARLERSGVELVEPFNDVAYGEGRFAAVGSYGLLYTSQDGSTWTLEVGATERSQYDVAFDSRTKRIIAVGASVITYKEASN